MKKFRDKDTYEYRISISGGAERFCVSFTDSAGRRHDVEVTREVFMAMQKFKRDENRQDYANERYISHFISESSDEELNRLAFYSVPETEDVVLRTELTDVIADIIRSLSRAQRRRFVMRHIDGMTYSAIARAECCSRQSAYDSAIAAELSFKKLFEKFSKLP